MPTVVELLDELKSYKDKNCPKNLSKMRKAELLELVGRISRIRKQRVAGVKVIKTARRTKLIEPADSEIKTQPIKELKAPPGKKFTSDANFPWKRQSKKPLKTGYASAVKKGKATKKAAAAKAATQRKVRDTIESNLMWKKKIATKKKTTEEKKKTKAAALAAAKRKVRDTIEANLILKKKIAQRRKNRKGKK